MSSLPNAREIRCGIAAVLLLMAVGGCASSGPQPPTGSDGRTANRVGPHGQIVAMPLALVFVGFDNDGDRRVTRAEVVEGANAEFAAMTAEGSGTLSPLEVRRWAELSLGSSDATPSWLSFDVDASGSVTASEFRARMLTSFDQLDKDEDAALTREELVTVSSRRGSRGGSSPQRNDRQPRP